MQTACPICREQHGPERSLSFDGKGVNDCGIYRARVATFTKDANTEALGNLFAAAPEMLKALLHIRDHNNGLAAVTRALAEKAIAKAEGRS